MVFEMVGNASLEVEPAGVRRAGLRCWRTEIGAGFTQRSWNQLFRGRRGRVVLLAGLSCIIGCQQNIDVHKYCISSAQTRSTRVKASHPLFHAHAIVNPKTSRQLISFYFILYVYRYIYKCGILLHTRKGV
jgi:hypothetical protein